MFRRFFSLLGLSSLVAAVNLTGYEYIVVGPGAGGGPLAARLALAGHKTLLIEAGDDQGDSYNYTVPAFSVKSSEDEAMAWNFFVRHYADDEQQARDYKTTYTTPEGGEYTGLHPPDGSTIKGTLYPRAGTLGGCTAHNALITIYPYQSDFDSIASLTGDSSWSAANMRKYFTRLENTGYLLPITPGHGRDGWLHTDVAPVSLILQEPQLLSLFLGGAFALGNLTDNVINLATLLAGDANKDSATRDSKPGYYQIPIASKDAHRNGPREFLHAVHSATTANGAKKYPLDIRTNCFVTKVTFDDSSPPRATGVEFLDGQYLYRASPRSSPSNTGTPGSATASREVLVAGGVYNSPQLLKLSGIGPKAELQSHNIPVISDLPGVGTNLQDHYEIAVQGHPPKNYSILNGCTFADSPADDRCLSRWENPILGSHGIYASAGAGAAMYHTSSQASSSDFDLLVFGAPANFRGYFPGYAEEAIARHDWFTWTILKSHPRNTAGTVILRSADPLDVPDIAFNYFETGAAADLDALAEGVQLARDAFTRQLLPVDEVLPGEGVKSREQIHQYARDTAWGHHASCTCPIGADDDPMAVLDSQFRVRGVKGLRVVDASVYPRIPGTFTALSTYMVAEKAAEVILEGV
ncbi:choline dehydrogenase [Aspergillus steynii IBT 23096]|uniref:Choline dehydrogenase n=1 Tax=Aspergillus steynii IBT 23096 TaxID=1392250 RepID=A0A2I2GI07_9EURO|nr:choline dehydrogenase [Aspergillus steynii IBT 23096]PLB52515.1 choline dehydrogenase [Aspergillus steynii IBT 23096]